MKCRIESIGSSLHFCELGNGSVKHAVAAAQKCLGLSIHPLSNIDYLINTGVYRDQHISEPAMAAFIQNELSLNSDLSGKRTFSFDLINGATGMLSGINVIISAINSGAARVGLVVSSESNLDHNPDPGYTYQPSGSALLIDMSPDPAKGFGSFLFKTFNQYSDLYQGIVSYREMGGKSYITKKAGLEEAYLECSALVFADLLKTEGLSAEHIDLVFPTQVSENFINKLPQTLGIDENKVINILDVIKDDTLTTSPFIAFEHAVSNNLISPASKVVFLTVGSGVTVGAALYNY